MLYFWILYHLIHVLNVESLQKCLLDLDTKICWDVLFSFTCTPPPKMTGIGNLKFLLAPFEKWNLKGSFFVGLWKICAKGPNFFGFFKEKIKTPN